MRVCRFCKADAFSSACVKYGVRHYAHFHCYLEAGRQLSDLYPWQVGRFPYRELEKHGLLDEASRILRENGIIRSA